MPKYIKLLIISAAVTLLSVNIAAAGGLSSHFTEVKLQDLDPGKTYSVKEMTSRSLDVINTTDNITTDIAIEPEKPVGYNLVKGYEPIPDLSWVEIKRNYFKDVGPNQSIETDIVIKVPPHKKYYGKKYQVYIYSHTAGAQTFRVGLMGRILFTISGKK